MSHRISGSSNLVDVRVIWARQEAREGEQQETGESERGDRAQGPVCLLRLDSGRYTVKASADGGKAVSQSVEVAPAGTPGKTLDYRF